MTKRKNDSKKISIKPKFDMTDMHLPASIKKQAVEDNWEEVKYAKEDQEDCVSILESSPEELDFHMKEHHENFKETCDYPIDNFRKKDESSVIVETLEFSDGKNSLKVHLVKKPNRLFSMQILINDKTEIRPVTYSGASMAYAYWDLLKGSLNK